MSAALQLKKWVVIIKYSHGRFSKFVIRRRGVWAREFWVLVSLPTFPRCPDGWDKRVSERFQRREVSDRFLAKLWAACFERKHTHTPPHTHTDTHTHTHTHRVPGVSSQQSNPTAAWPLLTLRVCLSTHCALERICVRTCMQSCVKFACWVHLYVCVRARLWWQQAD